MNSESGLYLLRSISNNVLDLSDGQENGIAREVGDDREMGEETQHFIVEVESIRKAFISKVGKVELDLSDGQENGITREVGDDREMGEETQHFIVEVESIRKAFISKVGKVQDLNQEVRLLLLAVVEAQKKGDYGTWLPSITVLAAGMAVCICCLDVVAFLC